MRVISIKKRVSREFYENFLGKFIAILNILQKTTFGLLFWYDFVYFSLLVQEYYKLSESEKITKM